MRTNIDRRVKALEVAHHVDEDSNETARLAAFLDTLPTDDLRQWLAITERSEAGISPTDEEQKFLDDMNEKFKRFNK